MAHIGNFAFLDHESFLAHLNLDRERLQAEIRQWNSERLDLFKISEPDEGLVFHGVMRFYLQDHTTGNSATKCIHVSSTSTTQEVIETLLEKFKPDVSTESHPYSIYEVCGNEDIEERRLDLSEKPLLVQLSWNKNTTEGSFILRKDSNVTFQNKDLEVKEKLGVIENFKRTLSKKQKTNKQKKNTNTSETYDGKSGGYMNCKDNNEQEKVVMNPSESECHVLRVEENISESNSRRSSTSHMKPAGRLEDGESPNKKGLLESLSEKLHQTFEAKNGSHFSDSIQSENSELKWSLPLSIKLEEKKEEAFLLAVVNYTNSSTVHFKLSPAYAFYLACRFMLIQGKENQKNPKKKAQRVAALVNKMVNLMDNVIQTQKGITVALAFWMSNTSEFLNFIRQDRDLAGITLHSQKALAELVQKTFTYLSHHLLVDLESQMPVFLCIQAAGIENVLASFTKTMGLLRRFRVNPALSIQLFSQLFHFMGAWLLNRLTKAASGSKLCSHYWGMTLRQRLNHVEAWAERQGLELAADCHLSCIIQATTLLTMNSYANEDAQKIHTTCFKLNSLQLRALLAKYHYAHKQPRIPYVLIESVVAMAESTEHETLKKEEKDIRIEKDLYLHLPFLLPEEGYSSEIVQGIPLGFQEFLEPICHKGLCTLNHHHLSLGSWTVYFQTSDSVPINRSKCKPEIVKMTLRKPSESGLGISIIAAKGAGQEKLGIFIKSVVHGGAAAVDGRLTPGDQLLSVDSKSLIGVAQERAAEILVCTGTSVTLVIAKLAAVYYGLEDVFNQSKSTSSDGDDSAEIVQTSKGFIVNGIPEQSVFASSALPVMKGYHHTTKRLIRKQDQKWFKHRQEYRSNPNLACAHQNSEEMSVDSVTPMQICASVSSDNLISTEEPESDRSNLWPDQNTFNREYLTLPVSRLQGSKLSGSSEPQLFSCFSLGRDNLNSMKQACSQENLSFMDIGSPLVDCPLYLDKGNDKQSGNPNISGSEMRNQDGQWKISAVANCVPMSQPKRIDVPVSHQDNTKLFGNFQQAGLAADRISLNSIYGTPAYGQVTNLEYISALQNYHLQQHKGPKLASKPVRQPYVSAQYPTSTKICETAQDIACQSFAKAQDKSKMSFSHTSHHRPGPQGYKTDGASPDPWKREAREQLKKQQRHQAVESLEHEVLRLQAKVECTKEESELLRRLSLEWQFQKRLQEFQNNEEDEDEEEDKDSMSGAILSQPELQRNEQPSEVLHNGQKICESLKQISQQQKNNPAEKDSFKDAVPVGCSAIKNTQQVRVMFGRLNNKNLMNTKAPENLTFRERQQLFSLAMIEPNKVQAS